MATPTDVDRAAPALTDLSIEINVPRDRVWRLHTDINAWPTWQSDITDSASGVHVTTTESFAGEPVAADVVNMQALLDQSLRSWLQQLKDAAEKS